MATEEASMTRLGAVAPVLREDAPVLLALLAIVCAAILF
jgi:hypothetical protein